MKSRNSLRSTTMRMLRLGIGYGLAAASMVSQAEVIVRPRPTLTLANDNLSAVAGSASDLSVTANDAIANAGAFVVSVTNQSAKGGTLQVVDNNVRYTPPASLATGDTDSFSYTITEENWIASAGGNLPVLSVDASGLGSSITEPDGGTYSVTNTPGFSNSTWDGVQYSSTNVGGNIETSSLYRHVIKPDLSADIQACAANAGAFDLSVTWSLTKTVGTAMGFEASITRSLSSPTSSDSETFWPVTETRELNLDLTGLTATELTDLNLGLWAQDAQDELAAAPANQNDWRSNSVQISYAINTAACQLASATAMVTVQIGLPTEGDGDSILDRDDLDDDNDSIPDRLEQNNGADVDSDGDGVVDRLDLDSDNDGLLDIQESGAPDLAVLDTDGNGRIDGVVGGNGLADVVETGADSGTTGYKLSDTDKDGVPDFQDLDSDNDGVTDLLETGASKSLDADNNARLDGAVGVDGIVDTLQSVVDNSGYDFNKDGTLELVRDTDSDGTPDFRDLDSDGDSLSDLVEGGGTDAVPVNADGLVDDFADSNGDGLDDGLAALPLSVPDTDSDGKANFQDTDSDNDGLSDKQEGLNDLNNDKVADYLQANGLIETGLGGGGCSIGATRAIDPMLPLLVVVSAYFVLRRRRKH